MSNKDIIMSAAGSSGPASDPNFNQTVLLLHGDGNQGANNFSNAGPTKYLAFSDNSDNNFPITVQGEAYGEDFSPYEGNYSNYFDGDTDYLTVPSNSAFDFPNDFCIEFWISIPNTTNTTYQRVLTRGGFQSGTQDWVIACRPSERAIFFQYGNPNVTLGVVNVLNAGLWHHIAVTRSGTTLRIFVDGVQGVSGTVSTNFTNTRILSVGTNYNLGEYLQGNLSNLRIVKGTAVYTSNFTPSTTPLTAISGTSLLTCQSNRFVDNSTNNFAITRNGDVKVSPFQPFTLAANSNGSGYFDGTGDYLSISDSSAFNMGSGNFTCECWIYTTNASATATFLSTSETTDFQGFFLGMSASQFYFLADGNGSSPWDVSIIGGTVVANTWTHVAGVRNGNVFTLYINGSSVGTTTQSITLTNSNNRIVVGGRTAASGQYLTGYLSDARVVKGTAVYISNFTPPTAPVANITNTSLLTCQYSGTVRNVGFIDSSPYDFPITRVGNTTQGTFSPFSAEAGKWSNYFDGATGYLSVADNEAFNFGSGDFTVEGWFYQQTQGVVRQIIGQHTTNSATNSSILIGSDNGNLFASVYVGSTITTITASASLIGLNRWVNFAFVRDGSNLRLFIDGTQITPVSIGTSTLNNSTMGIVLGQVMSNSGPDPNFTEFNGYISNVRVVKGRAVYTSNFTPSTVPLGATSGGTNPPQGTETSLLTCQSNRFVDNSTTPKAITRSGDVRVQAFSPFAPSAAYDPAVNGGSGYFDGTGDRLRVGTTGVPEFNFGSGNFTIEMFVYHSLLKDYSGLIGEVPGTTNNTINLYTYANGRVGATLLGVNEQIQTAAGVAVAGAWQHVALVRNGSVTTIYVDGVSRGTYSGSQNMLVGGTTGPSIGSTHGTGDLNGYIANLRILKGVAQYTANFTPPTAPPTAITNTSLLLNFTNAGIFDQTGKNVLETVGNAQIDTSVKKFGLGSMKFDGTGDYLLIPNSPNLILASGDFTIECWVNFAVVNSSYRRILGFQNGSALTSNYSYFLQLQNTNKIRAVVANGNTEYAINGTTTPSINTWYHVAFVRSGSTNTLYINGVSEGTTTISTFNTIADGRLAIGMDLDGVSYPLNGYIDDLRITKGVARYPTEPFPTKVFPNL